MTTRKMAEEADCLDFYNWVYQPWSDVAHSSWRHVSTCNLQFCGNPTHHNHRIPTVFDHSPNPHFLFLAGKYLDRAFEKFDQSMNIKTKSLSAFQQLCNDLDSLSKSKDDLTQDSEQERE